MTAPAQPTTAPRRWLAREIGATLALSGPIVLANVAVNLMTTTDVMMLGWLSPHALAAGALGYNLCTRTLLLFCIGVVGALAPLAASLVGADRKDFAGLRARAAIRRWRAPSCSPRRPGSCCGTPSPFCARSASRRTSPPTPRVTCTRCNGRSPPPCSISPRAARFAALDRVGPTLVAGLVAVVFNAGANYVLIFGKLGLPALGVVGSGLATTLSQTVDAAGPDWLVVPRPASAPLPAVRRQAAFRRRGLRARCGGSACRSARPSRRKSRSSAPPAWRWG